MFLVPREILFKLAAQKKHSYAFESEQSGLYDDFVQKSHEIFKQTKDMPDHMVSFTYGIEKMLMQSKNIVRFVGKGSSRTVYLLTDQTALKVAMTKSGIEQNNNEARLCMGECRYEIFPDFYGHDKEMHLSLNCEICAKAKRADFKELIGIQAEQIAYGLKALWQYSSPEAVEMYDQPEWRECIKSPKHIHDAFYVSSTRNMLRGKTEELFIEAAESLQRGRKPANCIAALLKFYNDYLPDDLCIGDMSDMDNWGIVIRDDIKQLVVLDAGLSSSVFNDYYKPNLRKTHELLERRHRR